MDQDKYKEIEKELKTRFALLPEEIQSIINSSDYQMKLFDVAKKYRWTYEQLGSLEMETTLVLLGMTNPDEYQNELAKELNKKPAEIKDAIEEIKQQVFDPIHTSLVSLYQKDTEETPVATDNSQALFAKSGVSIGASPTPASQIPVVPIQTENRADMIKGIENPAKSMPRVLNEMQVPPKAAPSMTPNGGSSGLNIPIPRAPYAGGAPTADAVKKEIPMTAKPAGDILAGKLGGTFSIPAKETDHSLKQGAAPTAPLGTPAQNPGTDSYREPLE